MELGDGDYYWGLLIPLAIGQYEFLYINPLSNFLKKWLIFFKKLKKIVN